MSDHANPDLSRPAPENLVSFPGSATGPGEAKTTGTIRNWKLAATGTMLAVAAGAAVWWFALPQTDVRYATSPVSRGAIIRGVTATGTVNPELTIIVGTYVSGVIQELYCDYNTEVKKGQLCAKIDPRPYQAVLDQNKANLAVAQAQLEKDKAALAYAKAAFDRNAKLLPTLAVSQDAYDITKSAYEQAQAQISFDQATIQQRQAELASAQVNIDYTDIISPVDGTVVSRNVTIGQTVAASFQTPTLFLIATDLTRMQVDTNVSESDVGGIVVGQKATFTVDAYPGRTFEGRVSQVRQSPQVVQNVVTYDIVVTTGNVDQALKPGLTAATRIILDQRADALRVPNAALRYRPSGTTAVADGRAQVWTLRDGKLASVAVTAGLADENFTEITGGDLKAGDQVVISEQSTAKSAATPAPRF